MGYAFAEVTHSAWLGFGISSDGTMTSGGAGSDVVVCDKDGVFRHDVTSYGISQSAGSQLNGKFEACVVSEGSPGCFLRGVLRRKVRSKEQSIRDKPTTYC